jgi:hypothetical protein
VYLEKLTVSNRDRLLSHGIVMVAHRHRSEREGERLVKAERVVIQDGAHNRWAPVAHCLNAEISAVDESSRKQYTTTVDAVKRFPPDL